MSFLGKQAPVLPIIISDSLDFYSAFGFLGEIGGIDISLLLPKLNALFLYPSPFLSSLSSSSCFEDSLESSV
jgi:hypothetical protein